jgi:hypothetical protein
MRSPDTSLRNASNAELEDFCGLMRRLWSGERVVGHEGACRWVDQFDAGADGIVIHACTPREAAPVLDAYRRIRPHARFEGRSGAPA